MLHESQVPRSCDRCHALKERCQRLAGSPKCDRCSRLRLPCHSNRPIKPAGRRPYPYHYLRGTSMTSSPPSPTSPTPKDEKCVTLYPSLSIPGGSSGVDYDLHIMERILSDDFIKQFVFPSFCSAHRKTLVSQFLRSRALVQDAYVACAISLPSPGEDACAPLHEVRLTSSYCRASAALAALRCLQIREVHDIPSCLVLGGTLLTFALRLGGDEAFAICSSVLGMAKEFYESKGNTASVDLAFMTCLVLMEMLECLMRTKIPTLRLRPPSTPCVDRFVGVCQTLLPYIYDLCQLSNDMLHNASNDMSERLVALEQAIRSWRPDIPKDLVRDFTSMEVSHLICQANVMQTAVLLVIHRLRHPFGTEQDTALAMASGILTQLGMTRWITGHTPRCVDLPLIIACLEIEDEEERIWHLRNSSSIGVYSGLFLERVRNWIAAVWEARRRRSGMHWYDLGSVVATPT